MRDVKKERKTKKKKKRRKKHAETIFLLKAKVGK